MKNKKIITLGFISVGFAITLLFSTNIFANTTDKNIKKETSRLEALAKFTKVIGIVEQYNVDDVTIEELTVDGDKKASGNARFLGIGFLDAGGTIRNVTVKNIELATPPAGDVAMEAIYIKNFDGDIKIFAFANIFFSMYLRYAK